MHPQHLTAQIDVVGTGFGARSDNALAVATYLESHDKVEWVRYAGLPSSEYHELAKRYCPNGAGAVFTFGWTQPEPEPEPEPEPPGDRDGDGLTDDVDECPDDPEDFDEFEDEDGCPEPDNDQDGILDEPDQCPNDPEDVDDFEDEDGCPDPDNDLSIRLR